MGIEKQRESDKITGDKFESAIDRAAASGPGRKSGQSEPDEDGEELDIEERDDTDVEDSDDE